MAHQPFFHFLYSFCRCCCHFGGPAHVFCGYRAGFRGAASVFGGDASVFGGVAAICGSDGVFVEVIVAVVLSVASWQR
eukprot:3701004-Rhodomonas_salina.1